MHKIILTSQARRDMHQIKEYISRRLQNPIAAKNTLSALIKEFRKLEQFPAMVCCMAGRITLRFYLEKIYHRMTEIYNKEATP